MARGHKEQCANPRPSRGLTGVGMRGENLEKRVSKSRRGVCLLDLRMAGVLTRARRSTNFPLDLHIEIAWAPWAHRGGIV